MVPIFKVDMVAIVYLIIQVIICHFEEPELIKVDGYTFKGSHSDFSKKYLLPSAEENKFFPWKHILFIQRILPLER